MIDGPVCPEIIFVQLVCKQSWPPCRVPITTTVSTRSSTGASMTTTTRNQDGQGWSSNRKYRSTLRVHHHSSFLISSLARRAIRVTPRELIMRDGRGRSSIINKLLITARANARDSIRSRESHDSLSGNRKRFPPRRAPRPPIPCMRKLNPRRGNDSLKYRAAQPTPRWFFVISVRLR